MYLKPLISIQFFILSSIIFIFVFIREPIIYKTYLTYEFSKPNIIFETFINIYYWEILGLIMIIIFFISFTFKKYIVHNKDDFFNYLLLIKNSILIILFILFILQYSNKNTINEFINLSLSDYIYKSILTIIISLNNINPFNKIIFFLEKNNFLNLIFCLLSSTILILFLIQVFFSLFNKRFLLEKNKSIFVGTSILFLIYGLSNITMDIRIISSAIIPFYIFLNQNFFTIRNFSILIIVLILLSIFSAFI